MKCNYYVAQEDVFRVFFFFRINIICLYICIYIYMQTSMSMTRDSYSHRTQSCSVYFRSTRRPPYVELFFAWRALFADVKLCNIKKYAQTIHFVKIYKIQNVRRDLTELNLKLQKRYWECKFYASELHCIIILEILKKKSRQFEIREQKLRSTNQWFLKQTKKNGMKNHRVPRNTIVKRLKKIPRVSHAFDV